MFEVPVDEIAPGAMFTVLKKGGTQRPPGGVSPVQNGDGQ